MSETMFYILFALRTERHGYGVMQHVEELTQGRIVLGAGTIYTSLGKLEADGLVTVTSREDRRTNYLIPPAEPRSSARRPGGSRSCPDTPRRSCEDDARVVRPVPVSYTHLRAHETDSYLVCRL